MGDTTLHNQKCSGFPDKLHTFFVREIRFPNKQQLQTFGSASTANDDFDMTRRRWNKAQELK